MRVLDSKILVNAFTILLCEKKSHRAFQITKAISIDLTSSSFGLDCPHALIEIYEHLKLLLSVCSGVLNIGTPDKPTVDFHWPMLLICKINFLLNRL